MGKIRAVNERLIATLEDLQRGDRTALLPASRHHDRAGVLVLHQFVWRGHP